MGKKKGIKKKRSDKSIDEAIEAYIAEGLYGGIMRHNSWGCSEDVD